MPHILVTDGEQRSALAIVRSLGRAGREVSVCASVARPLAGASRYCRRTLTVTHPSVDPARFRADVQAIAARHRVDLVIPATDASVVALLDLRGTAAAPLIALPEEPAYSMLSDKRALMEVARASGVPVPEQVVVERRGERGPEVLAFARRHGFDVVLKPSRSATLVEGAVRRYGVTLARTEQELEERLAAYDSAAYPLMIQERISGPGLGVFVLARGGEALAVFAHRRIREKPPTGGVSVYRESVEPREDVRRSAEAILRHHAWTGVAMVEFKEDAATGTPYLMEVNGRFWGSLQLAVDAGVDFPELLVRVLLGEPVQPVPSYRVGLRSRWLWGDADHLLWVLRHGADHREAHAEIPPPWTALARFLVPWRPGDRLEILRLSDPRPFLRESAQWVGDVFRSRGSQSRITEADHGP